jgi:hypothetical protein
MAACLHTTLRQIGGAPTYVLTDNAWFTLETLSAAIGKSKVDGSTARTVARICRAHLIVIDDITTLTS